MEILDKE